METKKTLRTDYKPSKEEEKIIKFVYERFYSMRDNPARVEMVKEWDKAEAAWDQAEIASQQFEEWQADYYVPLTTGIIEQILSEMVDQSPRPIILPLSGEDTPKATVMRHTFEYTWNVADGDEELENILKDCLIYGNGFAQEYYWKDRRMIRSLSGMKDGEKGARLPEYKEVEIFEYDDCYMESVSPYELYFDEAARTINRGPYKARDAIRRVIMKEDDVTRFFSGDIWNHLGSAKYVKAGGDTEYYSHYRPPEDIKKEKEVEVLWYWSRSPDDALYIVANDVLLKMGPNPYKHKQLPFAMTYDIKRPHKFYHKGEAKLLESMQKELNKLRRMITDRNHLDIDKMWLVGRDESMNEEDLAVRPHGMIRTDDPSNYKSVEYGDIAASVGMTLQEISKDATRVTGVNDRIQSAKTPLTATDAAIKKEQMMQTIKAKLRRLEKGFLVDIGRMRVANIIQFYAQPKLEKILGEAGTQEYTNQLMTAQKQGLLQNIDGTMFRKKYREIRIKDKQLVPDARGQIIEQPTKGYSFFDLQPKYFIPHASGLFSIQFEAGSTMPVSKALMVKQTQDAVMQLMPLATSGIGYDPVKLGDELLTSLDKDPSQYKLDDAEKDVQDSRTEMTINMASQENDEITKSRPIPELGTPYATADHTRIHLAYLRSPPGKSLGEKQFQILTKHIMGEISAQSMRGEVTNLQGETPPATNLPGAPQQPQAGASPQVDPNMPNMIQGGEQTQGTVKGSMMTRVLGLLGRKR